MLWKAILVDGNTQSSKTSLSFKILSSKILKNKNNLVVVISQANNVANAVQTISRARTSPDILQYFKPTNVFRSSDIINNDADDNLMIVDFWNSKCMKKIYSFIQKTTAKWDQIIIVIDEADEGGIKGLSNRLKFVEQVEDISLVSVKVMFITATIANLSKSISEIASGEADMYTGIARCC